MNWLRNLTGGSPRESQKLLDAIQAKFYHFLTLIEQNHRVLKAVSDMEEKSQGEFLFDMHYLKSSLDEVRTGVSNLIEEMVSLGGETYEPLRAKYAEIDAKIESVLPGCRTIEEADLTVPFDQLCREKAGCVGSKSAQLGEMRSKLGLPVPDGFAISGWAYKRFLDDNDLQTRIAEMIESLDITGLEQLVDASEKIRNMVRAATIPEDVAMAIRAACADLTARSVEERFSLRSSAIGEDTQYSFAGQYATFLNVSSDEILERYQEILASKFTPQAIYYYLSHSLAESDLAMSVGCVVMIDAKASGVMYTQDPVKPQDDCLVINSIFGLGKYLVDGTLTPDVIRVSRTDGTVRETQIATKPVRLDLNREGGTVRVLIPRIEQASPSITQPQIKTLADCALKIEEHYGSPQDIEWAIDQKGQVFILQTRPLRVIEPSTIATEPDLSGLELILSGGQTVCPGAGGGPVCHVTSTEDLHDFPDGAVLVAPHSFAGLITVMGKAHAIVTETGGTANHMATIAREYRIPTLSGVGPLSAMKQGQEVTVDASSGAIYAGIQRDLIEARQPEYELFSDLAIFELLEKVLKQVSPLNLIHPRDKDFSISNCRTFHDITRFCHQKAMEEMFYGGLNIEHKDKISVRLKSDIPLKVNIIYVDRNLAAYRKKRHIEESDFGSEPMTNFWNGVKHEGWPSAPPKVDVKGFLSVLGTSMTQSDREDFSETSFAILGKEYMILSLRMGYHFTTIEAMCSGDSAKNYVRMEFKEGGASIDRRERRIRLIKEVLSRLGFEHHSVGDFLDSRIAYQKADVIGHLLYQLGRLTILTKQLDMALSTDQITDWYTKEIMKKLGVTSTRGERQ